jgi:hypothetical protein
MSKERALTVYYAVGRRSKPDWNVHCGEVVYRIQAAK